MFGIIVALKYPQEDTENRRKKTYCREFHRLILLALTLLITCSNITEFNGTEYVPQYNVTSYYHYYYYFI